MSLRFRFYRVMRRSKGSLMRLIVANILTIVGVGLLVSLINMRIGNIEERYGLVVWYSFLLGFSGLVTLNTVIELCGIGYSPAGSGPSQQRR